MTDSKEEFEYEDEEIDWENPFDEIRSAEINEITLMFLTNGVKRKLEDAKGKEYNQYRFRTQRLDIENPQEITFTTSSKTLIEEFQEEAPIKDKVAYITRSGSGVNTKYKVKWQK